MIRPYRLPLTKINNLLSSRCTLCSILMLTTALGLSACNNKDKRPGQTLVKVNGEEITMLQINEEITLVDAEADKKQLLESLIERQLIIDEAIRNKIHRSPEVIRATERAKSKIIEQAYLKNIVSKISEPTRAEINDYFQRHPEYFSVRKQFDLQQLIFATKDISDELKTTMDSAKSLDIIAAWLDRHNIRYTRGYLSRNSIDLPEQMATKLGKMKNGQLFIFNEGEKTMLNSITEIRNIPLTINAATPQIKQYLIRKKSREVIDAEIKQLRSLAKIEYLNEQVLSAHP